MDDISKAVLSVNIQDMETKLKVFDELYTKLNVFLDILNNKRFSYKKIAIHGMFQKVVYSFLLTLCQYKQNLYKRKK